MSLLRTYRPALLSGALALAVLLGAGFLFDRLTRRPPDRRESGRTVTEARAATGTRVDTEARQAVHAVLQRLDEHQQRLAQQDTRLNNVRTRTVERIERFVPGPASRNPAPVATPAPGSAPPPSPSVVIVKDEDAAPPGLTAPQLAEVITRTIESVDESRSESASTRETEFRTEAASASETQTESQEVTEVRAESESRTASEAKTETRDPVPDAGGEGGRLGVGVNSAAAPFVSYDVARVPLGPRVLGLGRVGAGLFLTKSGGAVDGGPQASFQPGRGNLFGMVGYQVRAKTPVVGIGFKF